MQIAVKVETGFNCNWRNIEPLQPEGFKGQTANEKETLKNSIVKNGFHDAFDVWKHDNKLLSIDGVHRKIALLELSEQGYEIPEQLPCTYVTAENETEAATIILSRNSQHSHIIRAAVLMEACAIPAKMIEAVVPQKNLEAWSESDNSITEQLTAEEDDFEFEDGGIETDIVIGDLFEIGEHRLLCGDSTDSDQVAKLMNEQKADMVFTDPPYSITTQGCGVLQKHFTKTAERIKDIVDFKPQEWLQTLPLYFNGNMNTFIFCNKDLIPDYLNYAKENNYNFNILVWCKKQVVPFTGGHHYSDIEYIIYLSKKPIFNNGLKEVEYRKYFVLDNEKSKDHPTIKPIEIIANEIQIASNKNGIVAECFTGSGSTMVASHQLKRKCYGMELDPKYCQVIIDRMRKLDPTLIIKRNGVIYE